MGKDKKAYRKRKKEKEAAAQLNDEAPNGSSAAHESDANVGVAAALKEKGKKAFINKNYDLALEIYDKAVEADSKDHTLFANRSATLLALGKTDRALQDADACIALMPEWSKGYYRKGRCLMEQLQYAEAYECYKQAQLRDSEDKTLQQALEDLEDVLKQLKIGEAQLTMSANPDGDKFERMCKWMKDGHCKFPMMYMQYYGPDSRGVHALCKIPRDSMVLYVPLSHIMTSEVAKESDIGTKINKNGVDLRSKHSYLAAYLCQEKAKENSFWKPYIDILPQKYRNMPIFFTDEELKELEGSFTLPKIFDRKQSLEEEYEAICRKVPEFRQYATHWDFVWARLVVITRIFGFNVKDNKTDGLVPYADMLNHKIPRETQWSFEDASNGFEIYTLKSIQRGEEIFDSYGRKCNSRFFINYGFTITDNEDNEAVFKVTINRNDPHYDMKIRLLGGLPEYANREFQIPANYQEKKTKECFSFLRFCHARDDEIVMLPEDASKIENIEPLTARNEIQVLRHIRQSAKITLQGFPTTLEEDSKWLSEHPFGSADNNLRNCVVMRHGEKVVLDWWIKTADEAVPLLEMNWKDLKQKAAKAYQANTPFNDYVTQVIIPLRKPYAKKK